MALNTHTHTHTHTLFQIIQEMGRFEGRERAEEEALKVTPKLEISKVPPTKTSVCAFYKSVYRPSSDVGSEIHMFFRIHMT